MNYSPYGSIGETPKWRLGLYALALADGRAGSRLANRQSGCGRNGLRCKGGHDEAIASGCGGRVVSRDGPRDRVAGDFWGRPGTHALSDYKAVSHAIRRFETALPSRPEMRRAVGHCLDALAKGET